MTHQVEQQNGIDGKRLAEESETWSRVLSGKTGLFIRWFAIIMSCFQLYTGFFECGHKRV